MLLSLVKNDLSDEIDHESEYYKYMMTNPKDDRKVTKLWTKAFHSNAISYKFVKPIPLKDRVKNWNVSPENFLTRLEALASRNKLCKEELLQIVKDYRKGRIWNKTHAKRFGNLLKKTKGKKNCGRYTIRYLDYTLSPNYSKDLNKKIERLQPYSQLIMK